MLIEFYGKNYGCFRDEFRLSMLATDIDPDSDRGIVEVKVEGDPEPLRLLRAAAIYGPNASGKSTIVRAAGALSTLISQTKHFASDRLLHPYEPFMLAEGPKQPVCLGIKAVVNDVVYDYSVCYGQATIKSEVLLKLSGDGSSVLLERHGQEVSGDWSSDPQFELVSSNFRSNALLLSLADSLVPNLAKSIAVGFKRLLLDPFAFLREYEFPRFVPYPEEAAARMALADNAFRSWLLAKLRSADIGIVDIHTSTTEPVVVYERQVDDATGELLHGFNERQKTFHQLALIHNGTSIARQLPFNHESMGTRRLIEMAPMLYELSRSDRILGLFIDEFDASMHPLLLRAIVEDFNCRIPARALCGQLVFATHETSLMDGEAKDAPLRRDQVYFTEKGPDGASRLYSVAEFKERNNLNMRRRYLQGRYGALPALGSFSE